MNIEIEKLKEEINELREEIADDSMRYLDEIIKVRRLREENALLRATLVKVLAANSNIMIKDE
jgi:hypothetical protein